MKVPTQGLRCTIVNGTLLAAAVLPLLAMVDDAWPFSDKEPSLVVENRWEPPKTLSAGEIAKLPHVEIRDKDRVYSGVLLSELFRLVDVIWEGHCSPLLTCYVSAEASDGYRVLFSIPEIDPNQCHKKVALVDRLDGKRLPHADGPFAIVEEDATQRGRWVRHACKITLVQATPRPRPNPAKAAKSPAGRVYLIGMGPGDAELVTLKAVRMLKEADRVYCFDYLTDEVARYVPREKITVASSLLMGRFRGQDVQRLSPELQERAKRNEAELTKFAPKVRELVAAGKTVAFADAGDPTIYCPWTWITEEFADLGPAVIPGLSSFNAANAALKQSVTNSGGSILISPGDDLGSPDKNGRLTATLVLFTHRTKFPELLERLQKRYPGDTPIAVVCEASYERQQVFYGKLATIGKQLEGVKLPHLYLVYAGDALTDPVSNRIPAAAGVAAK